MVNSIKNGEDIISNVHTHAAYSAEYGTGNDMFSDNINIKGKRVGDKAYAINNGLLSYLATPSGTLRRFDPSDESDIELFNDLPFDPNHPERK